MGIISKEQADQVESFSFADSNASITEASSWSLTAEQPDALPGPVPNADERVNANQGQSPSIPLPPDSDAQGAPIADHASTPVVEPVFTISDEVLGQFYEQAVLAGQEEGKNLVFAELTILQERFAGALDNLVCVSKELSSQNQVQVLALACQIAETLLRSELKTNPAKLVEMIQQAIAKQADRSEVLVRCSPGDFEYISNQKPHLASGDGEAFTIRVEEDASLEYGDFHIETTKGQMDGRISARLDEVKSALAGDENV